MLTIIRKIPPLLFLVSFSTVVTAQTVSNLRELVAREYRAGHYAESESNSRAAWQRKEFADRAGAKILSNLGTLWFEEERPVEAEEAYTKHRRLKKKEDRRWTRRYCGTWEPFTPFNAATKKLSRY